MTRMAGQAPVSQRAALAQLARQAALESRDVAAVEEVESVAAPGGCYEIKLRVVGRPVPLGRLASDLRQRVHRAARARGISDELGPVNVIVTDVEEER
jgi:hypothetical protein